MTDERTPIGLRAFSTPTTKVYDHDTYRYQTPEPDDDALYMLPPRPRKPRSQWECDWCGRRRTGQKHPHWIEGRVNPDIAWTPPRDWITIQFTRTVPGREYDHQAAYRVSREYCGSLCRAYAERYRGRLAQLTDALNWAANLPGVPQGVHEVLRRFTDKLLEVT